MTDSSTAAVAEVINPGDETGDSKGALPAAPTSATAVHDPNAVFDMSPAEFGERLENRRLNRKKLTDWIAASLEFGVDKHKLKGREFLGKPGGEKILSLLGLVARYPSFAEWDALARSGAKLPRMIVIYCHIYRGDTIVAEGIGSRDSEATAQKDDGTEYPVDNGSYNKSLKMAMKSAMLSAVLGLGLSDIFSQDYEDVAAATGDNAQQAKGGGKKSGNASGGKAKPEASNASPADIDGMVRKFDVLRAYVESECHIPATAVQISQRSEFTTLTEAQFKKRFPNGTISLNDFQSSFTGDFCEKFKPGRKFPPSKRQWETAEKLWSELGCCVVAIRNELGDDPPPPPPSKSDTGGGDNFADMDDVPF